MHVPLRLQLGIGPASALSMLGAVCIIGGLPGCGSKPPPPSAPPSAPVATAEAREVDDAQDAAMPGCDDARLIAVLTELGGGDVVSEAFVGELVLGAPVSRRIGQCEVGATADECLLSLAPEVSAGQVSSIVGTIGLGFEVPLEVDGNVRAVRVRGAEDLDRHVESLREAGHAVEPGEPRPLGRVVWEPAVCLSIRAVRQVRLPRAYASGVEAVRAMVALADVVDIVFDTDGTTFEVRCKARDEAEPPLLADGPCGELAG